MLAVDAGGTIVVIELKQESDDRILIQGLEYYDSVRTNIERFRQMYPDHDIAVQVEPKLALIASNFSPTVMSAARYVDVPLALYTYSYLRLGDKEGLYITEVSIPPSRDIGSGRKSVDEHVAYITDGDANQACQEVLEWLRELDPHSITHHGLKYRISVKYRGNNFVIIHTRRGFFNISWRPDWKGQKVSMPEEFTDRMKDQLRQCFAEMGGLPPDTEQLEDDAQD